MAVTGGQAGPSRVQLGATSRGLISETGLLVTYIAQATVATQVIFGGLVGLGAGDVVTSVAVCVTTVGVGATPTTIKMGLVDTGGVVLATTANLAADAKWTAAIGPQSFALSAPYTVTASGGYYVVFLQDGVFAGTALQISRSNNINGTDRALGSSARPIVNGGSGKTDITGTLTFANAGSGVAYWFGVL